MTFSSIVTMARLFAAYDRLLTSNPILTKTVTSVVLFTAGDVMAQRLENGSFENLDAARLARQGAWGALFTPLAHAWYLNLDKWVPGSGVYVVATKVAADQLTWTPFINTVFLGTVTLMTGAGVGAAVQAVEDKLWPTLKVNWLVWPGLTAINLGLVPPPYRILFINFCSLGWSAFLSNMANSKPTPALTIDAQPAVAMPPPKALA